MTLRVFVGDVLIGALNVGALALIFAVHPELSIGSDLFTGCAYTLYLAIAVGRIWSSNAA